MTDKPRDPEVLDAAQVLAPMIRPAGNPKGNPNWKKGGPSPNPDGAGAGGSTTTRLLKRRIRDWLDDQGLDRLIEISMSPATDPAVAVATILKMASYVMPVAKEGDQDLDDPTGQGGTQTRTFTLRVVKTTKEPGGG